MSMLHDPELGPKTRTTLAVVVSVAVAILAIAGVYWSLDARVGAEEVAGKGHDARLVRVEEKVQTHEVALARLALLVDRLEAAANRLDPPPRTLRPPKPP